VIAAAGCSQPASTPDYRGNAVADCKALVRATAVVPDKAFGYTPLSAVTVTIEDQAGQLAPGFRRDVLAVIDTGLTKPSVAAVGKLSADCAALGVPGDIWPVELTQE
jgi:hypothetical protein